MIIQKNKIIYSVYFIVVLFCFILLLIKDKASIHLFINEHNTHYTDIFFKYITILGDGIFVLIVSVLLILWKVRYALYSISVYLISGLFVQICKRLIWPDAPRPLSYFGEEVLYLVEGIKMNYNHSFPSGHSASAFGLFFVLILLVKNKNLQWLFFVFALCVGYSRMYLSQHFLIDVIVGSLFGMTCALTMYNMFMNMKGKWLDYSLLKQNDK